MIEGKDLTKLRKNYQKTTIEIASDEQFDAVKAMNILF
jgi:hypothetical protein